MNAAYAGKVNVISGDTGIKSVKRIMILTLVTAAVFCLIFGVYEYILNNYTVNNIYVTGNTHYTDQEIADMVLTDRLSHNSVYLALFYRNRSITGIPFIEKMDVTIMDKDTVRISVYEKAVAGYIRYLGRYLYFDRDGIIVESSMEETEGIPLVMGLSFDHAVLHEELPVSNREVFSEILNVTKLLTKYELKVDRIFFDSDYRLYLYFGDVEVYVGSNDNIDEKIIALQYILPNLEEKKGLLDMHEYTNSRDSITFEEKY